MPGGDILVETSRAPIPWVKGGVGLPGGERFEDYGTYLEFTPNGEVVHEWGPPRPFPIDDYMTVSGIFRVIDGTLYQFYWSRARADPPEVVIVHRPPPLRPPTPIPGLVPLTTALPSAVDASLRAFTAHRR